MKPALLLLPLLVTSLLHGQTLPGQLEPYTPIALSRPLPEPGQTPLQPANAFLPLGENSLPELLDTLPGNAMQSRGAASGEPNIRGFGFDRIQTRVAGIPLLNASPTRTHAPLNLFGPGLAPAATLYPALTPLHAGPPPTGALIAIDPYPLLNTGRSGQATLFADSDRSGYTASGHLTESRTRTAIRAAGFYRDLDDYSSGNGSIVAAGQKDYAASVSGTHASANHHHETRAAVIHHRLLLGENPALPLDSQNGHTTLFTAGHTWKPRPGDSAASLQSITIRGGLSHAEPHLTNVDRTTAPFAIYANAEADTTYLQLAGSLAPTGDADRLRLDAGIDYTGESRDATRFRPGATDKLWPDIRTDNIGGFARLERIRDDRIPADLSLALRLDRLDSDARATNQLAFGQTVRQQYINYNGPEAATIEQTDWLPAATFTADSRLRDSLDARLGLGYARIAPGATQRYRSFVNALGGGFEIGNPALDPEEKLEVAIDLRWRPLDKPDRLRLGLSTWFAQINDYIYRQQVATTAPPPPPPPGQRVFGYRNIDAYFYGLTATAEWKPLDNLTLPASFGIATGRNDTFGGRLPEIPPWEARAGARFEQSIRTTPTWIEARVHITGSQSNPDPVRNPLYDSTGSYAIWNLRAGFEPLANLRVEAGLENIFDQVGYNYLTPPTGAFAPASGNLTPGQRIPVPGRTVTLSASWRF